MLAVLDAEDAEFEPVGTASSPEQVLEQLDALSPDVLLLDIELSEQGVTTLTRQVKAQWPEVRVLMLSPPSHGTEVCRDLSDGAEAVVMATADEPDLTQAILEVLSEPERAPRRKRQPPPGAALSKREIHILQCMAQGLRNTEIASALSISVSTVKAHVEHILRKLEVSDRASAVAKGLREGLIR